MNENVVADTSFYICYECDMKYRNGLLTFLNTYSFFIGNNILEELPDSLINCEPINSKIQFFEDNFFEIVKPFYGRNTDHKKDGEYEAIGIAYHLNLHYSLKYLIIDDKIAYNFVKNNFTQLEPKLIRTIGFIKNSCDDNYISTECAIKMLNEIKKAVETNMEQNNTKRPCSVDPTLYHKILIPLIKQLNDKTSI